MKIQKYNNKFLSENYFRPLMHSQSLNINHPKQDDTISKLRLPTPPSYQKRRQFQNIKTQNYTKSNLGTSSHSGAWHVSLRQGESDDSGKGDSEWSDISEFSTRNSFKHSFIEDKPNINSNTKASNKTSDNKLKVLRMAENIIKQKISQNHDKFIVF